MPSRVPGVRHSIDVSSVSDEQKNEWMTKWMNKIERHIIFTYYIVKMSLLCKLIYTLNKITIRISTALFLRTWQSVIRIHLDSGDGW